MQTCFSPMVPDLGRLPAVVPCDVYPIPSIFQRLESQLWARVPTNVQPLPDRPAWNAGTIVFVTTPILSPQRSFFPSFLPCPPSCCSD